MNPQNEESHKVVLYSPAQVFLTFRIQGEKQSRNINKVLTYIIEKERYRKDSALQVKLEKVTKWLYHLPRNAPQCTYLVGIYTNDGLEGCLTPQKLKAYKRGLKYLEEKNLPMQYLYNLADSLAFMDEKFLYQSGENLFNNIAIRYLTNTRLVLAGIGSPKLGKTVYNTLPKAFSHLFFQKIEFAGNILKNKKIRKDFIECLTYGFSEQIISTNKRLLQCNSEKELYLLIESFLNRFNTLMWVPAQILSEYNQIKIYLENSASSLLEYLMIDYLWTNCNYGLAQNLPKDINPVKIIEGLKKQSNDKVKNPYDSKNKCSLLEHP